MGINNSDDMPTEGLVLYAPLSTNKAITEDGKFIIAYSGTPIIDSGIPCTHLNNTSNINFNAYSTSSWVSGNHSISHSCWIKGISPVRYDDMIYYGENTEFAKFCILGYTSFCKLYNGAERDVLNININMFESIWHHVCATYDKESKVMSLFIDGELRGTKTSSSDIVFNIDSSKWQGLIICNNDFGNIMYSSYRMYDRVLTQSEIQQLAAEFIPTT